ncbi:restriction endonuclease subunit S [Tepidibacter formicigenes]|jgi:restriction endonuclease S subunit|uniref:Type I restriction modification DNA specificity domain-containing protein n=1 Tax=Tepidibacter formicigenes DSM 15518 TaxID=1123349 RepID=A0A1M6RL17_9FIRM|nr:restriction endonuclease subunit S [Tepidibacter formicigenes]SHK33037.1 Type I restriction modification DNA specificity domain-containing protein [Tepidibacter formicigenes DSM 15518]
MRLCQIADIRTGLVVARKKATSSPAKKYKMLTLKSFEDYGYINMNELEEFESTEKLSPQYITQIGDVIMRLSYPYTAVYIDKSNKGILIPSLFNVIRLQDEKTIKGEFLALYLNSDHMKKLISRYSIGSAISIIKTSFIKDIKIENIPLDKQEKLVQINKLHLKEVTLLTDLIKEKETLYKGMFSTIIK